MMQITWETRLPENITFTHGIMYQCVLLLILVTPIITRADALTSVNGRQRYVSLEEKISLDKLWQK